jgi:DNA-binding PadR family transcriptional regulator
MSIRHSLLALLSTGPMYGQQLKVEFEARTGELWPLNVGQVYTTLNRLERDGLVAATNELDAALRPYVITAEGQAELATWFRAGPGDEPPPRDELVMKVLLAASVDPDGVVEVIQSHRRQTIEGMRRFTRLKALDDATPATLMMCDAELFRLEAAVRWLDSVDARLRSGARLTVATPAADVATTAGDGVAPAEVRS